VRRARTELTENGDDKTIEIAVLYLKYNDPDQTLNNLLASLLKQLVEELFQTFCKRSTVVTVTAKLHFLSTALHRHKQLNQSIHKGLLYYRCSGRVRRGNSLGFA